MNTPQEQAMAIDWEKLKGATLDDKALESLKGEFDTLDGKLTKAVSESISGRKAKDETIKEQKGLLDRLFERLGISSADEIDTLPDAKGQAEAARQYESKIKKAERERDEAIKGRTEIEGKYSTERKERALATAIAKHSFIDADEVRTLVGVRIKQEGDDFMFEGADGKLTTIDDAVAWMATAKPHLVKPAGNGGQGSGFKPGQQQGAKTMPRAQFEQLDPTAKVEASKQGVTLTD